MKYCYFDEINFFYTAYAGHFQAQINILFLINCFIQYLKLWGTVLVLCKHRTVGCGWHFICGLFFFSTFNLILIGVQTHANPGFNLRLNTMQKKGEGSMVWRSMSRVRIGNMPEKIDTPSLNLSNIECSVSVNREHSRTLEKMLLLF